MLPWNRSPNFRTGASSPRLQRKVGRHRVAVQSTARFATRAASAPSTKLQRPAPATAAAIATTLNVTVSAVSAIVSGTYASRRSSSTMAGMRSDESTTSSASQRTGAATSLDTPGHRASGAAVMIAAPRTSARTKVAVNAPLRPVVRSRSRRWISAAPSPSSLNRTPSVITKMRIA